MSIESWVSLWTVVLWLSAGAFGALALLITIRYAKQLFGK